MDYVLNTFMSLVDGTKLITILALIGIDFLMGIAIAIKEGNFELNKVGNYLNTSVLYFLGGYLLLGLAAVFEPEISVELVTGAWVTLDATMVGFIIMKAKKLGLPIPDKIGFLRIPK
jgi:hypothetical protein